MSTSEVKILPTVRDSAVNQKNISVVLPVFRNSESLPVLAQQIDTVMTNNNFNYEILFVDDASDDDSWQTIEALAETSAHIHGYRLAENRGQHLAVLFGLSRAQSPLCLVMDSDLQDPPEAFVRLLKAHRESGADVVFAGRVGTYQAWSRMLTSRLYRKLFLEKLVGLPGGAGMYFLISRTAVERLLKLSLPRNPMVIGLIAAAKLVCVSIPVQRSRRVYGQSAYTFFRRMKSAVTMLSCAFFTNHFVRDPQVKVLDSVVIAKRINSRTIRES